MILSLPFRNDSRKLGGFKGIVDFFWISNSTDLYVIVVLLV